MEVQPEVVGCDIPPASDRPTARAALGALAALLALASPAESVAADCEAPVVRTTAGPVCGALARGGFPGQERRRVYAYLGIPYAAPPIGSRRWAPPTTAAPWSTARQATRFGPSCPQDLPRGTTVPTSEDCLTLNVWTPDPSGSLPVMVFVHGGTFVHGGSAAPVLDGANLAATGPAVVVTLNYRLGALGFLAGLDPFAGNFGLLDQRLALEWVHDNAPAFGGDPARVTLFGESAGAMSVGIHLASPSSRDLFRAAILESNPYGVPYRTREQSLAYANALVRHLGCEPPRDPPACLLGKSADEIVAAQARLPILEPFLLGLAAFVPWGPVVGVPPLAAQPVGLAIDRPVVLGTNRDEGELFVALQERSIGRIGPIKYDLETDLVFGEHAGAVRSLYASVDEKSPFDALARMVTDDVFVCASRFVLQHARAPAWAYQFTQVPSFPIWPGIEACAPATGHVCHAAELPFVFGNAFAPELGAPAASFEEAELRLSRTMMRLWTGFATALEPPPAEPAWRPYTADDPFRLLLGWPLGSSLDLAARCRFWDALGYDQSPVLRRAAGRAAPSR